MVLLSVRVFSSISSSRWLAIVHPVATSVTVKVQTEWCGREGQVVLCNECDVSSVVGFADAAADVAVSAAVDSVVRLPLPLWASQYQASPSPPRSENKTMTYLSIPVSILGLISSVSCRCCQVVVMKGPGTPSKAVPGSWVVVAKQIRVMTWCSISAAQRTTSTHDFRRIATTISNHSLQLRSTQKAYISIQ